MGEAMKKTADLIRRTTGSKEKAENYLKAMKATIEKVDKITKTDIDPIYRQVLVRIDSRMKDSKYLPHILKKLMTVEQARIVLALPDPNLEPSAKADLDPSTMHVTDKFAQGLGMDRETVEKLLMDLYYKGVVLPTKKGWQTPRTYVQFKDAATNNPKVHDALGPEYFELWAAFVEEEGNYIRADIFKRVKESGATTYRVIPRWKSIENVPGVLPFESIKEILEGAQDSISLTNCPCRRAYNNRTCDIPIHSCINFGRNAEHNIYRGSGRKVALKEALDILAELDKYPLVHSAMNQRDVTKGILCNCHWDCCGFLQAYLAQSEMAITDLIEKSRFQAVCDPEKCTGCKKCIKVCMFGAAQMKADPKTGKERSSVDVEKCMGCGCCVVNCPSGARTMKLVRPPEHVPESVPGVWAETPKS